MENKVIDLKKSFVSSNKANFTSATGSQPSNPKGSFLLGQHYDNHYIKSTALRDVYENSPWASCAVDVIANAASKKYHLVPRNNLTQTADLTDPSLQPIIDFLSKPSPHENFQSLLNKIVVDLLVFGTCILSFKTTDSIGSTEHAIDSINKALVTTLEKAFALTPTISNELAEEIRTAVATNGIPLGLQILPFEQMNIVVDNNGVIIGYEQQLIQGGKFPFAPNQIIQIWHPKSRSVWGNSPLQPLLTLLTVSALIDRRQKVALQNDIVLDKVLRVSNAANDDEVKAFYEELVTKYRVGGSAANLLVTTADVEILDLHRSVDGDFLALSDKIRDTVLMKMGVPFSVASNTSGSASSYSAGSDTAYRLFVFNTVLPLVEHIQDSLNNKLMVHYKNIGLDYLIQIDPLDSDDEGDKEVVYNMMIRNGSASINSIRAKRGESPVEGGDCCFVDAKAPITVENLAKQPMPSVGPIAAPVPVAPSEVKPDSNEVKSAVIEAKKALRVINKSFERSNV